jgi:hypothetical protein
MPEANLSLYLGEIPCKDRPHHGSGLGGIKLVVAEFHLIVDPVDPPRFWL